MIRFTVKRLGVELERLVARNIPLERAFRLLEKKAATVEELVVIQVMEEVALEMQCQANLPYYAESSAREARMPSVALRR